MKDEEIVVLYWQRSENAIRETVAKYEAYLATIAYNVLFDSEDSEECVNDTYLAAWNSMPDKRPGVLSTFLGKITRHIAIDVYRKKYSLKRYASEYALSLSELEECFANTETPEQAFDAKTLESDVNTFVRKLSDKERNVFIGRYFFFDSVKTIAGYCGISEANVKTILFRTRYALKEYLIKEGFGL